MTDYTASLGFGLSLQFTPQDGGVGDGVAVDLDNSLKVTPPNKNAPLIKFTPLDGAMAGVEQGVPGKIEITECSMQFAYTTTRYQALHALLRRKGLFTLTMNDGMIYSAGSSGTGWAYMTKIGQSEVNDSSLQMIDCTFSVPGGWTPTAGNIANETKALTAGTATIDLTASPYSASGKHVQAITFKATSTNANTITIAKGASNGYAGLGASFSLTLDPGQQMTVYPISTAAAVGGTNKTLDLTGTLTQSVQVSILTV